MNLPSFSTGTRPRSRRQGTLGFAATTYILTGLSLVRGVVLVPLYLDHIGDLMYGAWLATGSIVAYLGLCDCGLTSVIMQKVAEAYGARDARRLSQYLGSGLITVCLFSPLPALVGITCAPYLPRLLAVPAGEGQILETAFITASCAASLMILGHALAGIVCALQRQLLHGLIWVAATGIGLLITVILLLSGYGLMALPLGFLTESCLIPGMEGAVFYQIRRQILPGSSLVVAWDAVVELMKPSVMMLMAGGGATLTRQSDNLLIGMFMGSRAVLVYDLTKRAFELLRMLMGYPVAAFAPALAHFFGELREKAAKARGLTETLIHLSSLTGLVLIGGYIILDRAFVGLWVGPTLYAGDLVVILIGIYGLLAAQTLPLYHIVFNRGRIYTAALANLTEALLRIALVAILTWWLGLPGAALAGLLSLAATGWWILWQRYCLDFNLPWMESLHLLPLALVGVGILGIGVFLRQLTAPTTVLAFLFHSGCYLGTACLWVVLVDRRARGLVADVCRGRPLVFSGPT